MGFSKRTRAGGAAKDVLSENSPATIAPPSSTIHKAYRYEVQPTRGQLELCRKHVGVARFTYNWGLARRIADAGWREFRRQLDYKTKWYGSRLVVAPRFYPSSKTCSSCGRVKVRLTLAERTFICDECGFSLDRDLNAARNLEKLATGSFPGSNACGDSRRPERHSPRRKRRRQPSRKQESAVSEMTTV